MKRIFSQNITMHEFMKRKPYKVPSDYDAFYLKIQRDLFSLLNKSDYSGMVLDMEHKIELSYRLTSYFEDVVNGIGIWKALRKCHIDLYERKLPLLEVDEESYDDDDINIEDIQFIIYTSLVTFANETPDRYAIISSAAQNIRLTAIEVYNYLDSFNEVSVTDFYKNYFHVDDGTDYFDFKYRLSWFALAGYLTGYEVSKKSMENLESMNESGGKTDLALVSRMMYELDEQLIRTCQTRWSGLTPLDIMSELVVCSEAKRAEIKNLKYKHEGIYHLQGEDKDNYFFYHTGIQKDYCVTKNSMEGMKLKSIDKEYYHAGFIQWNNQFWLSGILYEARITPDEIRAQNLKMQNKFYQYDDDVKKLLDENASDYAQAMKEFFKTQMIAYDSGKKLEDDLNKFHQWHFDNKVIKENLDKEKKPAFFRFDKKITNSKDIALFIPDKNNFEIIFSHSMFIKSFSKSRTMFSNKEINELMQFVTDESLSQEYLEAIYKEYGLSSFELAFRAHIRDAFDLEFLLRLYSPHRYIDKDAPRFTVYNSNTDSKTFEAYKKMMKRAED